jgi:hypothetical protein
LVFGHLGLEEALFFVQIDGFAHPGEGVLGTKIELIDCLLEKLLYKSELPM